jgi:hypothetical protein
MQNAAHDAEGKTKTGMQVQASCGSSFACLPALLAGSYFLARSTYVWGSDSTRCSWELSGMTEYDYSFDNSSCK